MSCYHPLLGLPKGVSAETGKMQYLIKPWPKGINSTSEQHHHYKSRSQNTPNHDTLIQVNSG